MFVRETYEQPLYRADVVAYSVRLSTRNKFVGYVHRYYYFLSFCGKSAIFDELLEVVMKVVISVISVAVFVWSVEAISDEFVEELYIKPLYSEQVLAHFQFSTKWDTDVTSNSCKYSYYSIFSC